jgi:hypothetical protein
MRIPQIGDDVIFVAESGTPRAAKIVYVWNEDIGCVNLYIYPTGRSAEDLMLKTSVNFNSDPKVGNSWHYAEGAQFRFEVIVAGDRDLKYGRETIKSGAIGYWYPTTGKIRFSLSDVSGIGADQQPVYDEDLQDNDGEAFISPGPELRQQIEDNQGVTLSDGDSLLDMLSYLREGHPATAEAIDPNEVTGVNMQASAELVAGTQLHSEIASGRRPSIKLGPAMQQIIAGMLSSGHPIMNDLRERARSLEIPSSLLPKLPELFAEIVLASPEPVAPGMPAIRE